MGNEPQPVDRLEARDLVLRAIAAIVLITISFIALAAV